MPDHTLTATETRQLAEAHRLLFALTRRHAAHCPCPLCAATLLTEPDDRREVSYEPRQPAE